MIVHIVRAADFNAAQLGRLADLVSRLPERSALATFLGCVIDRLEHGLDLEVIATNRPPSRSGALSVARGIGHPSDVGQEQRMGAGYEPKVRDLLVSRVR